MKTHRRSSFTKSNGTFVKATTVKEHCRPYSAAYLFWHDRFKNEASNWPNKNEKSVNWSDEQALKTLEALEDIPEELWSKTVKSINRMSKSKDYPNPASSGNGTIVLYDTAFQPKKNLARILVHELAHEKYEQFSDKDRTDYSLRSGWSLDYSPDGVIYWKANKSKLVAADSESSRNEDFANNIEYYLFEPGLLGQKNPDAYNWIKTKFGDKFKLRSKTK